MDLLGVILAAVAGMVIGYVWFGPLFGKQWIKLSGFTQEEMNEAKVKGMNKTYALAFLLVLIMAWGLNLLVEGADTSGALRIGFIAWLAVIVPTMGNSLLWEGKNKKLVYINVAERLVTILVMSAIVALI